MILLKKDSLFKKIFNINLLYANPAATTQMRKKRILDSENDYISKKILRNIILGSLVMMIIYGGFFFMINFRKTPYIYDYSVAAIILLNIFQTFTYYYNIFYESNDVKGYMALPIKEKTVFYSKLAVIVVSTIQLSIPLLLCSIIFHYKMGVNIVISLLFGIIDYILYLSVIVITNALITNLFSRIFVLSKFKRTIINTITFITMILNAVFIVFINMLSNKTAFQQIKSNDIKYGPISTLFSNYSSYMVTVFILLVILVILYKISLGRTADSFYDYIIKLNDNKNLNNIKLKNKNIKSYKTKSIFNVLMSYNKSLISDTTVLSQTLFGIMFPLLILIPQFYGSGSGYLKEIISNNGLVSAVIFAVFLSLISNFSLNNIAAVIISLDRENYKYIKSLPVSQKKYIMIKYLFSSIFNNVMILSLTLIIEIFFLKLKIIEILISMPIVVIITMIYTLRWIIFDYKNLNLNWQNTTELYSRKGKGFVFIIYFFAIILLMASVAITGMLIKSGYSKIILAIITVIIIISMIIAFIKGRKFFNSLD